MYFELERKLIFFKNIIKGSIDDILIYCTTYIHEVRQLKISNKKSKYFTDENGHIKIRIGVNDRDKHRITYFWNSGETVTLNKDELLKFVHKHVK